MDLLQSITENSQWPFLTAFALGLMTAISPCPLATNITAIGFISKDINQSRQIFFNGIYYALGRVSSYLSLGVLITLGAEQFSIASFLQTYGEKILGPLLMFAGLFMLDFISFTGPSFSAFSERIGKSKNLGKGFSAFLLGVVFALAFCPYSGALFFGVLIPMSVSSDFGLFLPALFAISTAVPVVMVAWLLAYSMHRVGNFYNRIKVFEKWFRRVVAVSFIGVGIRYVILLFI